MTYKAFTARSQIVCVNRLVRPRRRVLKRRAHRTCRPCDPSRSGDTRFKRVERRQKATSSHRPPSPQHASHPGRFSDPSQARPLPVLSVLHKCEEVARIRAQGQ